MVMDKLSIQINGANSIGTPISIMIKYRNTLTTHDIWITPLYQEKSHTCAKTHCYILMAYGDVCIEKKIDYLIQRCASMNYSV